MLEKLTPEQEALMYEVRDKWNDQLFKLPELNLEQLTVGVKWLYKYCGFEEPQIIVCESIHEAQITVNQMKHGDKWRENFSVEPLCSYGDINDYGWVAFYDFFTQIDVINNEDFNAFKALVSSGYFSMIQMDTHCFVIKNPVHIHRNEQNQMNSVDDYAIKFSDGTGMYYVNGLFVTDELFDKLQNETYTFEDFSKETNEEIKSACISYMQQKHGDSYLFDFLSANMKEIDSYVDKKDEKYLVGTTQSMTVGVYTLFKGKVNDVQIAYVRCYCPSTDRMFFLGVDPKFKSAKNAIASLYTVPKKLVNQNKSINRQGERFSTTFTEDGKALLKTLTKEDFEDMTTITGDKYFSLMKYEY